MSNSEEKKPIFKKWWFWAIIIVIVMVIGGAGTNNQNTPTTTLSEGSSPTQNEQISNESEEKNYNVGEIYQNNSIAIKYSSVNENYTDYNEYADIKDGYKIVKADFEAENLGTSDAYFSAYEFDCYADGYDCEAFWSFDGSGFSSTLSSGKKAKGTVCFQVPTNATSITIEYTLNTFTGDKVEFLVK